MNVHSRAETIPLLTKRDPAKPAFVVAGPTSIAIRAGTQFGDVTFDRDAAIDVPSGGYEPGADYGVSITADGIGVSRLAVAPTFEIHPTTIGGFHFAPGGNATGRSGGDATPAINSCSCWDLNFRPACSDPRGMTLIETSHGGKFWCDIYLLGIDHMTDGTSRFGATIADGDDLPQNPKGGRCRRFDYDAARAVFAHHGKRLLSFDEFAWAAFGVTEKSACGKDPKIAGLDAARTSRAGVMQATGSMWVWGHDGDPDDPRPSVFGGSWFGGSFAGSRFAFLDDWPGVSHGSMGARGRSDHLQLD